MILKRKIVLLAVLFCLVLSGCTNTYYSGEQEKEVVAKGEELLRQYLDQSHTGYTLEKCYMGTGAIVDGNIFAGYYASDVVEGYYKVAEKSHKIAVNIKTGEVYTDEQNEALDAYVTEKISHYLAEAGYETTIRVKFVSLDYKIISKDVKSGSKTLDTEVHLYDMIPANYGSGNFDKLLSTENTAGEFYKMTILFHEDETGIFPNDAVRRFCEESPFFQKGEIRICNLEKAEFDDILAGMKDYHYTMKKSEEYSIFPGDAKPEESQE